MRTTSSLIGSPRPIRVARDSSESTSIQTAAVQMLTWTVGLWAASGPLGPLGTSTTVAISDPSLPRVPWSDAIVTVPARGTPSQHSGGEWSLE
ncbi:hypothetical protein AOLI_G00322310 [Acnodon oligacanthus]